MRPMHFACSATHRPNGGGASPVPVILSIDDDPNFRQSLKRMFSRYQVTLHQANQGMHSIWRVTNELPDLVITDLKWPQGRGRNVATCLRKDSRTSHIPIIVVTGLFDEVLKRHMLDIGVEGYLTKPIQFERLRDVVGRLIELRENDPDATAPGHSSEPLAAATA